MKIVLQACELKDGTDYRTAECAVEWPVVPREGENVSIEGTYYGVQSVWHEMDEPDGKIILHFEFDTNQFDRLPDDRWTKQGERP